MHTIRVGVIFLFAAALTTMLLPGCGGGADPGAKVEDSLRNYLGTVNPDETGFPVGAGLPRVRHNACRDGHIKNPKGELLSDRSGFWKAKFPEDVALWACVITFGDFAQPATIAVTGNRRVVWAVPVPLDGFIDSGVRVFFCTADTCTKQATQAQERAALRKAQASPLVAKAVCVSKMQVLEIFRKEYPQLAQSQNNRWAPDALVITPKRAADARRVAALFGSRSRYGINLVN